MKNILLSSSAIVAVCFFSVPTAAQTADDVVVMRRVITTKKVSTPTQMTPVEGADTTNPYWVTSYWLAPPASCSDNVTQKRLRGCVFDGKMVAENLCPSPAPETERQTFDYSNCGYSWRVDSVGEWAEQCAQTTRPVSASCYRRDVRDSKSVWEVTSDASCASVGSKPVSESGYNPNGCSTGSSGNFEWIINDWSEWNSECSDKALRTRSVSCKNSDTGEIVSPANCGAPAPSTSETAPIFSNCSAIYSWKTGEWEPSSAACGAEVSETRLVTCVDNDQNVAADAFCTEAKPEAQRNAMNYDSCSFGWSVSEWSEYDSTCSQAAKRTRTAACTRSDGSTVPVSFCNLSQKPNEEETSAITTGCSYAWNAGVWSDPSVTTEGCVSSSLRIRDVTCRRTDAQTVSDSFCADEKPASTSVTEDYSNCSFDWSIKSSSDWSSNCSLTAEQTRTYECKRGDGVVVADSFCTSPKPPENFTQMETSGCSYAWATGVWSDWSSNCSSQSTRTRTVTCSTNISGQTISGKVENCTDTKPSTQETSEIYSDCTASWQEGPWGWNGVAEAKSSTCSDSPQQTRTVTCTITNEQGQKVTISDSSCGVKPATTQNLSSDYSGCTYKWNLGDWGWNNIPGAWSSTCSASAIQSRTVSCIREETNATVSSSFCPVPTPDTQSSPILNVTDCSGLVSNGSFETSNSWAISGSGTGYSSARKSDGNSSMYVAANGKFSQDIEFIQGKTYSISLYCSKSSNSGSGNPVFVQVRNGTSNLFQVSASCPSTTQFSQFTTSYTHTGATATYTFEIAGRISIPNAYIDQIIVNIPNP
jgi:hypothetical protein